MDIDGCQWDLSSKSQPPVSTLAYMSAGLSWQVLLCQPPHLPLTYRTSLQSARSFVQEPLLLPSDHVQASGVAGPESERTRPGQKASVVQYTDDPKGDSPKHGNVPCKPQGLRLQRGWSTTLSSCPCNLHPALFPRNCTASILSSPTL